MRTAPVAIIIAVLTLSPLRAQEAEEPLTTGGIIRLLNEGISEDVILEKISVSGCRCNSSAFDIMALKGAGASDTLIRAVINSKPPRVGVTPGTEPGPARQAPPEPTRATVFGGYSYGRSVGDFRDFNWNGINGSVTGHVNDWFGITGDLSWHFTEIPPGLDVNLLFFGVGPQFSTWGRTRRVRGFGHVLFGVSRVDAELLGLVSDAETSFSTAVGGGIDVGVTEHFGFRVFQSDWVRLWDIGGESGDFLRLSFGVVGRF